MTLATTVSLPVIRGPAQLAKTLAAIDILSDGRRWSAWPGSSARDYAAAGISFDERWPRFGEAIPMLRACSRVIRPSRATSTRLTASISSRARHRGRHRLSGSPPGAHRPAYGAWLGPATGGWRLPTTPPPSFSARVSHAWRRRWSRRAGQSPSRTRSRPPGSTSPKTFALRSVCSPMSSPRCSTGRWRSCAAVATDRTRRSVRRAHRGLRRRWRAAAVCLASA